MDVFYNYFDLLEFYGLSGNYFLHYYWGHIKPFPKDYTIPEDILDYFPQFKENETESFFNFENGILEEIEEIDLKPNLNKSKVNITNKVTNKVTNKKPFPRRRNHKRKN